MFIFKCMICRLIVLYSLLLIIIFAGSTSAQFSGEGLLLVTHDENAMVTFVDLRSGVVVDSINVGEGPYEVVVSPDGKRAVVTHFGRADFGSTLSVIDVQSRLLERIVQLPAFSRPHGIAFLPDPQKVIVTLEEYDSFAIVNVETGEVEKIVETGQLVGHNLAVDIENNRAFIANLGSNSITVIDLNTYGIIKHIAVGNGPGDLAVTPYGREIWVTLRSDNTISIISSDSLEVFATIPTGYYPTRIRFTPDGKDALVCLPRWGEVMMFSRIGREYIQSIIPDKDRKSYEMEDELRYEPKEGLFYKNNDVVNREKRIELIEQNLIFMPSDILFTPKNGFAFISSANQNNIAIVDLAGGAQDPVLVALIPFSQNPEGMAFASLTYSGDVSVSEFENIESTTDLSTMVAISFKPQVEFFAEFDEADSLEFANEHEAYFKIILRPDELSEYDALGSLDQKKNFVKRYWMKSDPNPLVAINYNLAEYSSRVQFAKQEFGISSYPFIDDRGKIYIQYGKWYDRYRDLGGARRIKFLEDEQDVFNFLFDPLAPAHFQQPQVLFISFPNESWAYRLNNDEQVLHFVKEGEAYKRVPSLDYATPNRRRSSRTWQWMELIKDRYHLSNHLNEIVSEINQFEQDLTSQIDQYEQDIDNPISVAALARGSEQIAFNEPHGIIFEKKLSLESVEKFEVYQLDPVAFRGSVGISIITFDQIITQFKGENGKTDTDVLFYYPFIELEHKDKKKYTDQIQLVHSLMLRDKEFNNVKLSEKRIKISESEYANSGKEDIVVQLSFTSQPDIYESTLQIEDKRNNTLGFTKDDLLIRDFTGSDLMLSDMQLYLPVITPAQRRFLPVDVKSDVEVTPLASAELLKSEAIFVYFEGYNLTDSGMSGRYILDVQVGPPDDKPGGLNRLFRRDVDYAISIRQERSITQNDIFELMSLDFSNVNTGDYDLTVTITDPQNAEHSVSVSKRIKVIK